MKVAFNFIFLKSWTETEMDTGVAKAAQSFIMDLPAVPRKGDVVRLFVDGGEEMEKPEWFKEHAGADGSKLLDELWRWINEHAPEAMEVSWVEWDLASGIPCVYLIEETHEA